MKLAIATMNGEFCAHFGGSSHFMMYEIENGEAKKLDTVEAPPHQPGLLPRWLHELGVNAIVTGGMGGRAIQLLEQAGMEAIICPSDASPDELAAQYARGELSSTGGACAGHGHDHAGENCSH